MQLRGVLKTLHRQQAGFIVKTSDHKLMKFNVAPCENGDALMQALLARCQAVVVDQPALSPQEQVILSQPNWNRLFDVGTGKACSA